METHLYLLVTDYELTLESSTLDIAKAIRIESTINGTWERIAWNSHMSDVVQDVIDFMESQNETEESADLETVRRSRFPFIMTGEQLVINADSIRNRGGVTIRSEIKTDSDGIPTSVHHHSIAHVWRKDDSTIITKTVGGLYQEYPIGVGFTVYL